MAKKKRKLWIKRARVRRHAPRGLFKNGSARQIAKWARSGVGISRAAKSIVFYMNRAGKKLSAERRRTLKHALKLVLKKKTTSKKLRRKTRRK